MMERDRNRTGPGPQPSRKTIWIIGAILIALLVLVSLYGIVTGTGEAVGVEEAAPGGANADPPALGNGTDPRP